jgi:hypothetical protein
VPVASIMGFWSLRLADHGELGGIRPVRDQKSMIAERGSREPPSTIGRGLNP